MKRKIIIGDIHGCFDEFEKLLIKIGVTEEDEIISVGDIVDRGPKSVALYDYFRNKKNAKVIIGNHERKHINGVLSYAQEIVKIQFGKRYDEFVNWLKEQRKEVLSGSTSGSRYLEKKYEENNWLSHYAGEKPIIYGHHVVGEKPKIENNTYGLDTGACHGGHLTALELPSFTIHQIKVADDYWKAERKKWQLAVLEAKEWNKMTFDKIERQISRLKYIEDISIQNYLSAKEEWTKKHLLKIEDLRLLLKSKSKEIITKFGIKAFNVHAKKYPYKVMLFRIKANNLSLEEMKRQLNTPEKIQQLEAQLSMPS